MIQKSFNVQKRAVGTSITAIRTYLTGKKIKIISVAGGHNYGPVGTVLELTNIATASISSSSINYGIPNGNTLRFTEFTVLTEITSKEIKEDIKMYKEQLKEIEASITQCNNKLDYLKEIGSDKFDDNEFKAYETLKLVDNKKLSTIEKAKLIAKLIN